MFDCTSAVIIVCNMVLLTEEWLWSSGLVLTLNTNCDSVCSLHLSHCYSMLSRKPSTLFGVCYIGKKGTPASFNRWSFCRWSPAFVSTQNNSSFPQYTCRHLVLSIKQKWFKCFTFWRTFYIWFLFILFFPKKLYYETLFNIEILVAATWL